MFLPPGEVDLLSLVNTIRSIWKVWRKKQKTDHDKNLHSNIKKTSVKTAPTIPIGRSYENRNEFAFGESFLRDSLRENRQAEHETPTSL